MLEEVAEATDAIEDSAGRPTRQVSEELGDVLMNVFLSAKIAEDEGGFDISEVARGISEKLIRRHPHVFGDRSVKGVDEVLHNWRAIKEQEKNREHGARPPSRLDCVPRSLPCLERAHEIGRQAAKVGFDWPDPRGALEKVLEEAAEVQTALERGNGESEGKRSHLQDELGDLLFAVVNLCRKLEVPPAEALRRTLKKFCERFRAIEERFSDLENVSLEEMESVWQKAKSAPAPAERDTPGRCPP